MHITLKNVKNRTERAFQKVHVGMRSKHLKLAEKFT